MSYIYSPTIGRIYDADDGQHIATTSDSATPEQGHLLAAAPDLLDALKELREYHKSDFTLNDHLRLIDAAIAKVERREFKPDMHFKSVAEAVEIICQQIHPFEALMAVVRSNLDEGEFGFASELITAYGERT